MAIQLGIGGKAKKDNTLGNNLTFHGAVNNLHESVASTLSNNSNIPTTTNDSKFDNVPINPIYTNCGAEKAKCLPAVRKIAKDNNIDLAHLRSQNPARISLMAVWAKAKRRFAAVLLDVGTANTFSYIPNKICFWDPLAARR